MDGIVPCVVAEKEGEALQEGQRLVRLGVKCGARRQNGRRK